VSDEKLKREEEMHLLTRSIAPLPEIETLILTAYYQLLMKEAYDSGRNAIKAKFVLRDYTCVGGCWNGLQLVTFAILVSL
jgi:hypothetical protein